MSPTSCGSAANAPAQECVVADGVRFDCDSIESDDHASTPDSQPDQHHGVDHMPSSHRRYAGWTMERIRADARLIGPATAALCELIFEARPHPEQGFRACLGIVRLGRSFGAERLEAAADRAIDIGARTYGSVKSILDNNLDRRPVQKRATDGTPILHANIRGPRYYN